MKVSMSYDFFRAKSNIINNDEGFLISVQLICYVIKVDSSSLDVEAGHSKNLKD